MFESLKKKMMSGMQFVLNKKDWFVSSEKLSLTVSLFHFLSLFLLPFWYRMPSLHSQIHACTQQSHCTLFAENVMVSWTSSGVRLRSQTIYLSKSHWGGPAWKASLHWLQIVIAWLVCLFIIGCTIAPKREGCDQIDANFSGKHLIICSACCFCA